MSLLSDVDITKAMRTRDIVIEPFSAGSLTPVGYDVRVGGWMASLTTGAVIEEARLRGGTKTGFWVPPHERVLVFSMEAIRTSRWIGGTLHTMVALAARGLSPISTTLDPGWAGILLITLTNMTDRPIFLEKGERMTTLTFYRVGRRASAQELNDTTKLEQIIERLAKEAGFSEAELDSLLKAKDTLDQIKEAERDHAIVVAKQRKADRWRRVQWIAGGALGLGLLVLVALALVTSNADLRATIEVALVSAIISIALALLLTRGNS